MEPLYGLPAPAFPIVSNPNPNASKPLPADPLKSEEPFLLLIQNLFGHKFIKKEIPVDIANRYFSFSYIYSIVIYRIYFIYIDDV